MKYKKGTFVVVPNTEYLIGKPQAQQLLFFWLCYHADESGQCFPSRAKLSKEIGCTTKTVDNYIKVLELDSVIEKTIRKISGKKENMSNLYQILQVENVDTPRSETTDPTPREPSDPVTIPNLNYINSTIITEVGNKITLPIKRGTTPHQRLLTIYNDCYYSFYGTAYKPTYARDLKLLKDLLVNYSELQIARMLTIFFNWHGMTGSDDREFNFLSGAAFSLGLFKMNVNKYEIYSRNVLQEKFDDDSELLTLVGKYILSLELSTVKTPQLLDK